MVSTIRKLNRLVLFVLSVKKNLKGERTRNIALKIAGINNTTRLIKIVTSTRKTKLESLTIKERLKRNVRYA